MLSGAGAGSLAALGAASEVAGAEPSGGDDSLLVGAASLSPVESGVGAASLTGGADDCLSASGCGGVVVLGSPGFLLSFDGLTAGARFGCLKGEDLSNEGCSCCFSEWSLWLCGLSISAKERLRKFQDLLLEEVASRT